MATVTNIYDLVDSLYYPRYVRIEIGKLQDRLFTSVTRTLEMLETVETLDIKACRDIDGTISALKSIDLRNPSSVTSDDDRKCDLSAATAEVTATEKRITAHLGNARIPDNLAATIALFAPSAHVPTVLTDIEDQFRLFAVQHPFKPRAAQVWLFRKTIETIYPYVLEGGKCTLRSIHIAIGSAKKWLTGRRAACLTWWATHSGSSTVSSLVRADLVARMAAIDGTNKSSRSPDQRAGQFIFC